jgi:hypothetical protein
MRFLSSGAVCAAALVRGIAAAHPTDEYRDADPQQTGYLPNHNLDPAVVNSAQFGLLWKVSFNNDGEKVRFSLVCFSCPCAPKNATLLRALPKLSSYSQHRLANALEA